MTQNVPQYHHDKKKIPGWGGLFVCTFGFRAYSFCAMVVLALRVWVAAVRLVGWPRRSWRRRRTGSVVAAKAAGGRVGAAAVAGPQLPAPVLSAGRSLCLYVCPIIPFPDPLLESSQW